MPTETTPAPQWLGLADEDDTFTVTDAELGLVMGSPDVSYELRPITRERVEAIKDKHRPKLWNKQARAYERELNQSAYEAELLDTVLVGWVGVKRRGQPAECNHDNRQRLDQIRQQLIVTKATMNRVQDTAAEEVAASDSFRAAD